MTNLLLFNKPFGVISQFSPSGDKPTLAQYIKEKKFYPAGRLDHDSEGLLLLTNNGQLQARIAEPRFKLEKTYLVQVDGEISQTAIESLQLGVDLKDGRTLPSKVRKIETPVIPPRNPPVRYRANIPTSWIEISIKEGKNRIVRRMTASVGFPTLRLFRSQIGSWQIKDINVGDYISLQVNLPKGTTKY